MANIANVANIQAEKHIRKVVCNLQLQNEN